MWSSTLQIDWQQRFFVPTEEEPGIAILAALLEQFPIIATEDEEAERDVPPDLSAMSHASTTYPIDLDTWIIETAEIRISDAIAEQGAMPERDTGPTSDVSETTYIRPIAHQVIAAAMLQTQSPDYRTAAIQIGFNFAESES
jgi:hypothetical protein